MMLGSDDDDDDSETRDLRLRLRRMLAGILERDNEEAVEVVDADADDSDSQREPSVVFNPNLLASSFSEDASGDGLIEQSGNESDEPGAFLEERGIERRQPRDRLDAPLEVPNHRRASLDDFSFDEENEALQDHLEIRHQRRDDFEENPQGLRVLGRLLQADIRRPPLFLNPNPLLFEPLPPLPELEFAPIDAANMFEGLNLRHQRLRKLRSTARRLPIIMDLDLDRRLAELLEQEAANRAAISRVQASTDAKRRLLDRGEFLGKRENLPDGDEK